MAAVLLTQPLPRAANLATRLREAGLDPVALTFERLEPIAAGLDELAGLHLSANDRVVLVSPSAVAFARPWLQRLAADTENIKDLPGFAVVGAGTASVFREIAPSLPVICPPAPPYGADALQALPAMQAQAYAGLVVLRGVHGRDDWIDALRATRKSVRVLALYQHHDEQPDAASLTRLDDLARSGEVALTMVGSTRLAGRLADLPLSASAAGWLRQQACLVSHPRVAAFLEARGFKSTLPASPGVPMLNAAIQWWQNQSVPPN